MSKSGVLGVLLGGVNEMKWDIGFEEGGICGSEDGVPFSEYTCSTEVEGFVRSLETAFVMDTFGGTRAI